MSKSGLVCITLEYCYEGDDGVETYEEIEVEGRVTQTEEPFGGLSGDFERNLTVEDVDMSWLSRDESAVHPEIQQEIMLQATGALMDKWDEDRKNHKGAFDPRHF